MIKYTDDIIYTKYNYLDCGLSLNINSVDLLKILPDNDYINIIQKSNIKTCAVIGNSSALLDTTYGELIDSHDIVIGFNFSPVLGFEKYVGSKSTIRIMGKSWLPPLSTYNDEIIIHRYNNRKYILDDITQCDILMNYKFCQFHHNFNTYCADISKFKVPSNGFMGVMLALNLCDVVNIFGFDVFNKCDRYHYFNDNDYISHINDTNGIGEYRENHNMIQEYYIYKQLMTELKLKIY